MGWKEDAKDVEEIKESWKEVLFLAGFAAFVSFPESSVQVQYFYTTSICVNGF